MPLAYFQANHFAADYFHAAVFFGGLEEVNTGSFIPSQRQVEEYLAHLHEMEEAQDRERAERRDLERRVTEALKWAYLDATDPEKAAALRAALAAAVPDYEEPADEAAARQLLERQWQELQTSLEATQRFVEELEWMQWEARWKALEEDSLIVLLLAA